MDPRDDAVRIAAFRFLDEQVRHSGEDGALRRTVLERGFVHARDRVPLVGPRGIFKPRILHEIPLIITTVPVVD
jgi:putative restriction endonuclease